MQYNNLFACYISAKCEYDPLYSLGKAGEVLGNLKSIQTLPLELSRLHSSADLSCGIEWVILHIWQEYNLLRTATQLSMIMITIVLNSEVTGN